MTLGCGSADGFSTAGLLCALFEHGTACVGLRAVTESRRIVPAGSKYGAHVHCEHIVSDNFISEISVVSGGQTHTGAVGFVLPPAAAFSVVYGCHLCFHGDNHPDPNGARTRAEQLHVLQRHARSVVQDRRQRWAGVFGDLNIRPIAPYPADADSETDSVTRLSHNDLLCDSWDKTDAWISSPHALSRRPPCHAPTHPIVVSAFERIFRNRSTANHPLVNPAALRDACAELKPEETLYALKKGRFTPASWCDGELTFAV